MLQQEISWQQKLLMLINSGWVEEAQKISSPNFNDRPKDVTINLVVIHCISLPPGKYGSNDIDNFFQNNLDVTKHEYFKSIASLKVSSHFLIKRTGNLKQYVSTDKRAWHAGVSKYGDQENCNDFSIGNNKSIVVFFKSQRVSPVVTSFNPIMAAISPALTSEISSLLLACI